MFKIEGLDKLQKQLADAQKAFEELDGTLGQVNFDPQDPASIESAIQHVNSLVHQRVGHYSSNPFVGPMIDDMKEAYRSAIIEKAAAARLGDSEASDEEHDSEQDDETNG